MIIIMSSVFSGAPRAPKLQKFEFGYDVISVHPCDRKSVRNPTMVIRPCLFGGKLHGEMRLQQIIV